MNFVRTILKRPVSILIVVLALIIFGFSAVVSSPMELMPDIEMPMLLVLTIYPGAGPQEVEELVTQKIEDSVSTLSGIKNVQSSSKENVSIAMLEMEYGTNMDVAHMDLQEKLDMYKGQLPDDCESPTIIEMSMDQMPVITLSAKATGDLDLLQYIDDEVTPEIEKLGGVASVDVYGGQGRYVSVQLNEEKMRQYKIDMNTVIGFVGAANFSIPAGDIDRGDQNLALRGGVNYNSTESLKNIPITLSSGKVIHLSDIANIFMASKDVTSISRYNGNDTVMLAVKKRSSAGTLDVTKAVTNQVTAINNRDMGVSLEVINDSSEQILSSIKAVFTTLIGAVLLCMIVLFVFFGDWKASLIVGSSIPVSVLTTLVLMNMFGFSLNVVSLGGLVIGVGMMVDNSIVVLDSCFQKRERKTSYHDAAVEGTGVVISSVVASTITTVVVFLPISIIQGLSGQLFRQLGFTIIFSLTASLISAITLVPLLFYRLTPVEKETSRLNVGLHKVQIVYGNFLKKTFRHKKWVVIVWVGVLVGSFALVKFIPFQLMPNVDQGQISINVETKPGLKLEKINEIMVDLEGMVTSSPDVERYSLSAGSGSMTSSGNSSGSITVYLRKDREKDTNEWIDEWRAKTGTSVNYTVDISSASATSGMGGSGGAQVNLQGNDLEVLREASKQVEDYMRGRSDIVRVSSNVNTGDPQAEIKVDPIRAGAVGLTPKQVVGTVYNVMSGNSPDTISIGGREYDIRIEFPGDQYKTISDLSSLMLSTPSGRMVPLLDVADIEYSNAPMSIDRQNNRYFLMVTGQTTTEAELTAPKEVDAAVAKMQFPAGVEIAQNSQTESMNEEFGALLGAIATAILLVFMVMAMQFESMRFSVIVMICIPFSLIGSFGLMLLSRVTMSMPSLIGFLMLVGTVVNNGILYIDTANNLRGSMDAETALVYAGRSRLRPILMTTLTTVLAMIPQALGIGDGAETMQGMAIVIIGGLTASTVLTLLLIPTFYLLLGGRPRKIYSNKEDLEQEQAKLLPEMSNEELHI